MRETIFFFCWISVAARQDSLHCPVFFFVFFLFLGGLIHKKWGGNSRVGGFFGNW